MRKFRKSGGFVPVLLALLLLFRLLIPSGYMIAPDQEGNPVLALCAAPVQAAAEAATHGGHEDHPADPAPSAPAPAGLPCAFAALSAPPLPPEPPAVAPQAPVAAVQPEPTTGLDLPPVASASPPPPPTGPPIPV